MQKLPTDLSEILTSDDPARQLFARLTADPHAEITPEDWAMLTECTDGDEWRKLIEVHPVAAEHCPWRQLDVCEWWPIFKYLPQYFEKCDCPGEVPPRAWAYLLCQRPELAPQFDRWNELTDKEWASLLQRQSALAEYCPCPEQAKALTPDQFDDGYLAFPTGDSTIDFLADTDYLNYYCSYGDVLLDELQQELAKEAQPAE